MAFLDISTGAFWMEEAAAEHAMEENLSRYAPSERDAVPAER
jgi:DNA mismatch repair ATPase MutS